MAAASLAATVALAVAVALAGRRARTRRQAERACSKIGWAQDPQTLNPFVGQDEEDFNVWALNWDLLVNFSPEGPHAGPGHREELGRLARTRRRSRST